MKYGIISYGMWAVFQHSFQEHLIILKVLDKGIIKQLKIQGPTYNKTPPLETMGGVFAHMGILRRTLYGQGGIVLSMALTHALLDILSRGSCISSTWLLWVYIPRRRITKSTGRAVCQGRERAAACGGLPLMGGPACAIHKGRGGGYILQSRPLFHDWKRAGG